MKQMDGNRELITGLGLITPLGGDVEQTWRALLAGETIRDHARVPAEILRRVCFSTPSSSLVPADGVLKHTLNEPDRANRIDAMACCAARKAIDHAKWTPDMLSNAATALVVGTSKGPVERWMTAPPASTSDKPSVVGFGLSELSTTVAESIGHGPGPRMTLSAACASGIHALIHAILLLRSGAARRALVVAAEASVHPLFLGSFKRLGVLAREGVGCRPFDRDRDGFLMSEAAAAVCVESEPASRPIARIDRFAMAGDATHLTGGDPEGRTLRYLLNKVINRRDVDLVHAHATGTAFNDPVELSAIESSLGHLQEQPPNVYSHKGALGHSLGAAGLVSVVLNCLSHQHGIIPPNVQTRRPIESRHVKLDQESVQRRIHHSIAIAAGFGGAVGVVSLRS